MLPPTLLMAMTRPAMTATRGHRPGPLYTHTQTGGSKVKCMKMKSWCHSVIMFTSKVPLIITYIVGPYRSSVEEGREKGERAIRWGKLELARNGDDISLLTLLFPLVAIWLRFCFNSGQSKANKSNSSSRAAAAAAASTSHLRR